MDQFDTFMKCKKAEVRPTPKIYYWTYLFDKNIIKGCVYNYPGHENGAPIETSRVEFALGKTFVTKSGSRYELGEPEHEFRQQLEWAGLYRPDNPLQPLLAMEHTSKVLGQIAGAQQQKSSEFSIDLSSTNKKRFGSSNFSRSYADFIRDQRMQSEMIKIQALRVQREVDQRKFARDEAARLELRRAVRQRQLQINRRHRMARVIQTAFRIHLAKKIRQRCREAERCLMTALRTYVLRKRFLVQRHSATIMQAIARGHQYRTSLQLSARSDHATRVSLRRPATPEWTCGDVLGEFRRSQGLQTDDDRWSTTDESDTPSMHTPMRKGSSRKNILGHKRHSKRGRVLANRGERGKIGNGSSAAHSSYLPGIDGLLTMCREYHGQDRPVECLAISERVLQLEPCHDLAMTCKGWALMRLKRYAEAEHVLQQAGLDVNLVICDTKGRFARKKMREDSHQATRKVATAARAQDDNNISFFGGYAGCDEEAPETASRTTVMMQRNQQAVIDSINSRMNHQHLHMSSTRSPGVAHVQVQDELLEF
eukprot:SAG31_NODE_4655_length_3066_cov_2.019211_3_plen_538_part_00